MTSQTYKDYEWIAIDGASTDGTVEWLGSLRIPNARAVTEPDKGIYDAMNKGIARSTGDYIIFMNAGDRFAAPDTLERLAAHIKTSDPPPGLIYGDALEDRPEQHKALAYKKARSHTDLKKGLFTHHQAILYKRDLLNTPTPLRYDIQYEIAADYKFTAQVLSRTENSLYWPHALCCFEAGGLSQKHTGCGRKEQAQIRLGLELTGPWENRLIMIRQGFATFLKRICPPLYWFFRQRF